MKKWIACDFMISVLVKAHEEDAVDVAIGKLEKLKLPKNITIDTLCTNITIEGEGLDMN